MQKDKKEAKRLYDIEYRRKNKVKRALHKKQYYEDNKASIGIKEKERRSNPNYVKSHNEYCMRSEYVKKKHTWDVVYRNMKKYGEFWESAVLVNQIEIEVRKIVPKNERLGYKRNVAKIISKNAQKRFENAVNEILNGKVDGDGINRIKNFKPERKELLKELLLSNN